MNWTKTPPTKPGAYWWRVDSSCSNLLKEIFNPCSDVVIDRQTDLQPRDVGGEWCGPLVPAEEVESLIADLLHLRNEVDCRIDHGAQHGGHLDYVKLCLTQIIDAHR